MTRLFSILLMFAGSCLHGCQVGLIPADKLFGDAAKAPKLVVKKTLCGFYAEAGTDFNGHLSANYNPDTKAFTLDGTVSSDAGSVLDKYPAWIGSMADIRKAEIAANIEINKLQAQKFHDGSVAISDVMRTLGTAGVGIAGQIAATLAGSQVDVTTPFGVGISGALGVPQPAPAAPLVKTVHPDGTITYAPVTP
jgi:hypothetical protein